MHSVGNKLSEQEVTLAEVLRGRGYVTGAFVANAILPEDAGYGQGFDRYQLVAKRD